MLATLWFWQNLYLNPINLAMWVIIEKEGCARWVPNTQYEDITCIFRVHLLYLKLSCRVYGPQFWAHLCKLQCGFICITICLSVLWTLENAWVLTTLHCPALLVSILIQRRQMTPWHHNDVTWHDKGQTVQTVELGQHTHRQTHTHMLPNLLSP